MAEEGLRFEDILLNNWHLGRTPTAPLNLASHNFNSHNSEINSSKTRNNMTKF